MKINMDREVWEGWTVQDFIDYMELMGTGLSRNEAAYLLFLCQGCGLNNRDIASFVRILQISPPSSVWDEMFE